MSHNVEVVLADAEVYYLEKNSFYCFFVPRILRFLYHILSLSPSPLSPELLSNLFSFSVL
jgi:hypothetical protein